MNEKDKKSISHVTCREVQAPLVSALIKGFSEKIGNKEAHAIASEVINRDAAESGRRLAKRFSGNSLFELRRVVEEVWAEDGTITIKNLHHNASTLEFDVSHCGYAEMYNRLGIQDLGVLLSCSRDFAFMDGFNSNIELFRTKTIMEGADVCDFCYRKKQP